jgi:DNA-binding GntR family transcriptional regulator
LLHDSGNYHTANAQHDFVLRSLIAGDGAAVSQGIRNDIEAAGEVLLGLLD